MSAHAITPQHAALANAFDDDRYDAIGEFADKAISYWISVREAAIRRERSTLEVHCPQIRVLTLAVFETVKALDFKSRDEERAA